MKKKLVLTVLIAVLIVAVAFAIKSAFDLDYSISNYRYMLEVNEDRIAHGLSTYSYYYVAEARAKIVNDIFKCVLTAVLIAVDIILLIATNRSKLLNDETYIRERQEQRELKKERKKKRLQDKIENL